MSAEKCPVCGGTGKFTQAPNPNTTCPMVEQTCHGCGGMGWVETYGWGTWVYRDPCDGCPHKKPYTITWGGYGGGTL
jgi:DnaJ-class molecular chaperone